MTNLEESEGVRGNWAALCHKFTAANLERAERPGRME